MMESLLFETRLLGRIGKNYFGLQLVECDKSRVKMWYLTDPIKLDPRVHALR